MHYFINLTLKYLVFAPEMFGLAPTYDIDIEIFGRK